MEIYNDRNIQNLVMVGGIKKHEYIQTNENEDMLSYLEHSFKRYVSPEVFRINETNTMKSLQNLFYHYLPKKIDKLVKKNSQNELKEIGSLLEKAIEGLTNYKTVYQGDAIEKYIDEFINDYAKKQIDVIFYILKPEEILNKKPLDILVK